MNDYGNHSSFEQFQLLETWLRINMQSSRKGRRFLETHTTLLETETDRELARLIAAYALEGPDIEQQMVQHLTLLRDIRKRARISGDCTQAIQEAYINAYSGSALDFPSHLVPIKENLDVLYRFRRPERTSRTRIALLKQAIRVAEHSENVVPELTATLHNELGRILVHEYHPLTQHDCMNALEDAIACHESALLVYTFRRYPLQYANTCIHLGTAWLQYAADLSDRGTPVSRHNGPSGAVERAIACFAAALHVYQRTPFPEQWARVQALLGRAYTLRMAGEPAENTERAIDYHEQALQVATPERFPTLWALVQTLLGDAYRLRRKGVQAHNFRFATACYKAAQQVFSQTLFPAEWAAVHSGLAFIYQNFPSRNALELDKRQGCAIVCYETALNVYTADAFPVEHAAMLLNLGDLHRTRSGGERSVNLKQAIRCYQYALYIFTRDAFPLEYSKAQHKLSEAQALHESMMAVPL